MATSRPAGSLRVIEELHELGVDVRRNAGVGCQSAARWSARRPARCPRRAPGRQSSSGTAEASNLERAAAGGGHLRRMADEAEARDVGAGVHDAGRQRSAGPRPPRGSAWSSSAWRPPIASAGARSNLSAVEMIPVPSGFGQEELVAGLRAGVRPDRRREHLAGDGVAELDLGVLDGVAAEQRHAGLGELVEAALEDRREDRCGRRLSESAAIASAVSGRPPIA